MASVIVAIPDLMFRSKVIEAANALGVTFDVVRDPDEVIRKVREEKPKLVLMDLQAQALRPLDTIKSLDGVPVVGFLAHAEVALRDQALAAGCGEVLTKGQFAASLPQILSRAL